MDFYNSGQNGVKVDTMTSRDYLNYLDSNELNAQILELQYTGREISFIVVLPKRRDEINPKPIALTPKADFSRINPNVGQAVAKVIHKTFISVDVMGTEAAAIMAIRLFKLSGFYTNTKPIIFRADHPFLYFIRDKTNGLILFYGQINQL
ncbi:unnamed protein product [Oppiella nova]|uniref:Serpin domain-containing protein n=1 Tax=Oppiella nova TaxID=334625 RepID=A0A7R9LK26_9ACAR|nr:unnamed protein product [Oppiella nova]CAG2164426.1 unnamed protein product [Oppiella nova]